MTATSLAKLKARCELMKTRIFAMALERGRESSRIAQAWGFVSRTMVSRDGARSEWRVC